MRLCVAACCSIRWNYVVIYYAVVWQHAAAFWRRAFTWHTTLCPAVIWFCFTKEFPSATSWSLVQRSLTDWRVVVCDLETSWMRRPCPIGGCCTKEKQRISNVETQNVSVHKWTLPCCGLCVGLVSRIVDTGCTNWPAHAFRIVIHRFKTVDTKPLESSYWEENICTPSQVTVLIFWHGRFIAVFTEPALRQTHLFHTLTSFVIFLAASVCCLIPN